MDIIVHTESSPEEARDHRRRFRIPGITDSREGREITLVLFQFRFLPQKERIVGRSSSVKGVKRVSFYGSRPICYRAIATQ